jgi:hypothetical protein
VARRIAAAGRTDAPPAVDTADCKGGHIQKAIRARASAT